MTAYDVILSANWLIFCFKLTTFRIRLKTQKIDSGAAWGTSKGLAGCIEKSEKKIILNLKLKTVEKVGKLTQNFIKILIFSMFTGRIGPSRGPRVWDRCLKAYPVYAFVFRMALRFENTYFGFHIFMNQQKYLCKDVTIRLNFF